MDTPYCMRAYACNQPSWFKLRSIENIGAIHGRTVSVTGVSWKDWFILGPVHCFRMHRRPHNQALLIKTLPDARQVE